MSQKAQKRVPYLDQVYSEWVSLGIEFFHMFLQIEIDEFEHQVQLIIRATVYRLEESMICKMSQHSRDKRVWGWTYFTIFSWFNSFSTLISRIAVEGTPSSPWDSNRIFFNATILFVRLSVALYTTPYVPINTSKKNALKHADRGKDLTFSDLSDLFIVFDRHELVVGRVKSREKEQGRPRVLFVVDALNLSPWDGRSRSMMRVLYEMTLTIQKKKRKSLVLQMSTI